MTSLRYDGITAWSESPIMDRADHATLEDLEAGLDAIRGSPKDNGLLQMIVCRPCVDARTVLQEATLDPTEGLVGDTWSTRQNARTSDGSPDPDTQLTLMNSRVIELVARERDRWPLAGDQLYVDFDLSDENLPPGTRLSIGTAVIEVTEQPHTGCNKFKARFGADAVKFVNSVAGRRLKLRGINAKVVQPGSIRVADIVRKLRGSSSGQRVHG